MKKNIIIIGAGIAGLTAARELQPEFDVMVLEASAHIGGRCRTAVRGGEILEYGAAFMQGSVADNPFAALAEAHGLRWAPSKTQRAIYSNGKKLSAPEQAAAEEFLVTIPKILQGTDNINSVDEFCETLTLPHQQIAALMLAGPTETGVELAEISPHDVADQHETGEFAIITGGWNGFLQNYAAGLNIVLNAPVSAVNYSGNGIHITAGGKLYSADYAIITVSAGVLNDGRIEFTPPLPDEKTRALADLPMGVLNKIFLCWKTPPLPAHELPLFWQRNDWLLEIWPQENPNVWCVVLGGKLAKGAEEDTEFLQKLLAELTCLSPHCSAENLVWHEATRWHADETTRGAYSVLRPGADKHTREAAGEPVAGKLFFAGEAYDAEYAATVVGAYRSGLRAAHKILASRG